MRCTSHKVDIVVIFCTADQIGCKRAVSKLMQREYFGVHSFQRHLRQQNQVVSAISTLLLAGRMYSRRGGFDRRPYAGHLDVAVSVERLTFAHRLQCK